MSQYYDPIMMLSSPEHPNTMAVVVKLTEEVDGEILRGCVERLRERFPYFYVKVRRVGNDLVVVENPLPMCVRNTWDPIQLNAEESNFHLGAWKYEGNRLAFELSHSISDGAGVLPYIKSAMYLYLSEKTGTCFDPAGFRLPGDEIPESETGNPFAGLDVDGAEEPLYQKQPAQDFLRVNDSGDIDPKVFFLKLSESQVMQYCRNLDGSPNAFFSVMLAKAARRLYPENDKTISVSVAIDHKAILGNHDNYHMFANVAEVDFPKSQSLDDVMKACTVARGQVMLQTQWENSLWAMRQRKEQHEILGAMPLETKAELFRKTAASPRWSLGVSYANSRTFGPLDPYIDELYVLVTTGVTDAFIEVTCINHCFFLSLLQGFASEDFLAAFLDELSQIGIVCEQMGTEPLRLCGVGPWPPDSLAQDSEHTL